MSNWPENWFDLPLAVIDIETTGLEFELGHRTTEIGIVRFERGELVETYSQLVYPKRKIPEHISKITKITDQDVAGKPTFDELIDEILERLTDVGVVGYNLFAFDYKFLCNELELYGKKWPENSLLIDPIIITRKLTPGFGNKKLGTMCDMFGIELTEAHRAYADATATGQLLYKLAEVYADNIPTKLTDFMAVLDIWKGEQEARRHRRDKKNGEQTLSQNVAVGLGNAFIYGVESDPLRALYSTVQPALPRED